MSSDKLTLGETNNIRIFSAKGISAPGVLGTSALPQIGTPIPGTTLLYVAPRLAQDEGLTGEGGGSQFPGMIGAGEPRSVHITNEHYSFYRRFQRTPSIGMAGAGQMGRNMTVPFEGTAGGFFSIP
jgi:hypothetical protein